MVALLGLLNYQHSLKEVDVSAFFFAQWIFDGLRDIIYGKFITGLNTFFIHLYIHDIILADHYLLTLGIKDSSPWLNWMPAEKAEGLHVGEACNVYSPYLPGLLRLLR